ncbi:glycosyltransferase family 2 protein [Rhodalgimonas zhirmunskyi]|uniref:Glycosyltransferase family 2 protein n=1 Tax=Rhodalgimonas zhirmunskyi TaxID=2964767 RepID=A0AAJ1U7V1_9RHOB|nr:glycosyltransferase family 2 protein [Rhodoalgimonas zhirmunskyi]MDQ2092913.1 glycosyltransferase family 2 protein [Rhodoalgimonas zhirmunskyi]
MQSKVAAVTMVREDLFFLRAWLKHYGDVLGRENCYIVNHGRGEEVADLAAGCNIIGIPGDPHKNFDMKRWRLLNNIVMGLRSYYDHIVVGDVDELVVVDPASGKSLLEYLWDAPIRQVMTPLGIEVIHRIDVEPEAITDHILGPRRYIRLAPHYSKPCVISAGTKIARGGHFTQYGKLNAPDDLYLFHLKFCDFPEYVAAMNRRNAVVQDIGTGVKETAIGRHWFAEARGEDRAVFEAFADLEPVEGFDMSPYRAEMRDTFSKRGDTGYFHFARPEYAVQFELPERFFGLF